MMGIETDGYEVLRTAVSVADIDCLRSVLDEAYKRHAPHAVNRWIRADAVDSAELNRVMRSLYRLVAKPFGFLCEGHSFLKRIEPSEYDTAKIRWHRDADAAGTDPFGDCLNIWVPLDGVGVDCPSLEFVSGSHSVMRGIQTTLPKTGQFEEIAPSAMPHLAVVTPQLAPGDVVIFDHHTLHRTQHVSGILKTRRSLECRVAFNFRLYMKMMAKRLIVQS